MRRLIYLCLALALIISISACANESKSPQYATVEEDNTVTYNTNESTDALNYTLYVNKEISMVLNLLEGHMTNAQYVKDGKYPLADELDNVAESLDMVAEAITSVELLNPPKDYEDDRDAILRRMVNVQGTLTDYKDALDTSDLSKLDEYADIMSGDFTSLKSYFNNMWE